MREYVIVTDACADLDQAMADELGVVVQPMLFTLDGEPHAHYPDGREMGYPEFYTQLREGGISSTSQITSIEFTEAFRPHLVAGKDLLYLAFSSGLSGTVDSARMAARDLAESFPEARIVVVDTLAASLGQGLLVWHAAQQQKAGKGIAEVAEWVEKNKLRLAHWFTVDDLNFLKRGGRLSSAAAFFGTMLSIKPVLHVDDEGHLIAMEKVRGRRQSLDALVNHMEKTAEDPGGQMVFISHGDAKEDADYVAAEVRRRFGTKDIYISYIGPVIGSHSGPGTVALFFLGSSR